MALQEYNKKRKFDETSEPEGKEKSSKGKLIFVVQRHSATRLHYDFRLEMEGVLKSWAVPKGPSLNPEDKRLAMMTEDHPYNYKDFEGNIPDGNYGAGEVEVWDSGTYEPLEKSDQSDDLEMQQELKKGSIKIVLHGEKLKGEFALVKIKNSEEGNAWLLIKHRDKYALNAYDSEDHVPKKSKVTSREENRPGKKKAKKEKISEDSLIKNFHNVAPIISSEKKVKNFIVPMLAQPSDNKPFNNKDWVFEIKWDGYRAIADLRENNIQLYSRNGLSYLSKFSKITEALKDQQYEMVLDGEIVVFNENGKPDFQLLQKIGENPDLAITFQVFDLLWLNGHSTENLTFLQRKELLKGALVENDFIKYCEHIPENGIDFFKQVKEMELEGMIAKKADSTYSEGVRSSDWLKIKFQNTEDVLICGFTAPRGARKNFGALILGRFVNGKLEYCGHTGTGFNDSALKDLYQVFEPLIIKTCPFEKVPKTNMPATWMKPELVCEIKFTEFTNDGIFRHPVFMGIRTDKELKNLKETKENENIKESLNENPDKAEKKAEVQKPKKMQIMKDERENNQERKIGKQTLKFTNQNKIYFPESGFTKGDLVEYYQSVAEFILPHIKDRPQSLNRFPNGIGGLSFYQKDAGDEAPKWVETETVFSESNSKDIQYVLCNNAESLAYLNNLGCIEINPWNSTVKNLENPTWMAIDLDPSEKNNFEQVIETALCVKSFLDAAKIDGYCKTSGSSGLHIFIPMGAKYDFEHVKNFAHLLMQKVQKELPALTTLERNLKKRGEEKIYLDYLQNRSGQTLASAYSVRPKPFAPVSMPLEWKEVKSGLKPTDFTIENALQRIKKTGDLFKPVLGKGIDMLKSLENLEKS